MTHATNQGHLYIYSLLRRKSLNDPTETSNRGIVVWNKFHALIKASRLDAEKFMKSYRSCLYFDSSTSHGIYVRIRQQGIGNKTQASSMHVLHMTKPLTLAMICYIIR